MLRVHRVKGEGPGFSSMSPDREQTKEERDCGSEGSVSEYTTRRRRKWYG